MSFLLGNIVVSIFSSLRASSLSSTIRPAEEHPKILSRPSLLPAGPLPCFTVLPAKLPHFPGKSALRSGLPEKTPTLRHHLQHFLLKLVSTHFPLTSFIITLRLEKGSKSFYTCPSCREPPAKHFILGIPGLTTNSLPRFAWDDCSDCGLSRWFPCVSSLSSPSPSFHAHKHRFVFCCSNVTPCDRACPQKNRRISVATFCNTRETAFTSCAEI